MTVRNPELVKNGIKGGVLIGGASGNGERRRRRSKNPNNSNDGGLVIVETRGEQSYEPLPEDSDRQDEGDYEDGDDLLGEEEEGEESRLTFLPPDPTYYFRRLYESLLHHDYALMSSLPPDEDVSLSILSPLHETFLLLVRKRWRVPVTLKAATFVALVAGLYKGMGVPEECVGEALEEVERVEEKWRYWRWPLVDVS